MSKPINEIYIKATQLIFAIEKKPLTEMPDRTWIGSIDDSWMIGIHANQGQEIEFEAEGIMGGKAKSGIMLVWYNGWLAGTLDPYGGSMAAGEEANEDTLIEAINKRLEALNENQI